MQDQLFCGLNRELLSSEREKIGNILGQDQSLTRQKRADLQRFLGELDHLGELGDKFFSNSSELQQLNKDFEDLNENDDYVILLKEEIEKLQSEQEMLNSELKKFIFASDDRDTKSCFVEIRAGAGGQEAAIFASDLLRMYTNFSLQKDWEPSISSVSYTDLKGIREVFLYIKGKLAFGTLKFESGVHRVQRVPVTESAGRIHTSTVTVAVMAEADEIEVDIKEDQLRIDYFRSSGAGGQHVNTTDSAVRITHLPTGIVVTCQDERSQIKNKTKALKELRARIFEEEHRKAEEARSLDRKNKIGSGDRSEKIRTYNFPQNRVTDHRIDFSLKKLDMVLDGDFSEIVEMLEREDLKSRKINEKFSYLFNL